MGTRPGHVESFSTQAPEGRAPRSKRGAKELGTRTRGQLCQGRPVLVGAEQLRTRDTARTRASQANAAREPARKARRTAGEAGEARTGGEKGANGTAMLQQNEKDTVNVNGAHVTAHADTPHARHAKRSRGTPSAGRRFGPAPPSLPCSVVEYGNQYVIVIFSIYLPLLFKSLPAAPTRLVD